MFMSLLWFNPYITIPMKGDENAPLFTFSNFTFTKAGATFQNGPTLLQCQSSYSGAVWLSSYFSLYNDIQGYQKWTVPSTDKYFIMAVGAAGGRNASRWGGFGSLAFTTVSLNKSDELIMIIGQTGQEGSTTQAAGAGGGSFVIRKTNTTYPLIAAGGGGGCGNQTTGGHGRMFYSGTSVKSTDAYPIMDVTTSSTSLAGTASTNGNAGSGFSVDGGTGTAAKAFFNGFIGGLISGGKYGGFGGGGGGGLSSGTFTGGGGGGWCGGKASATTGDGGYIASKNFCESSFSGHLWHNSFNNVTLLSDGRVYIKKITPTTLSTFSVTFTSCGVSNGYGPSFTQMNSAYAGNSLIIDYLVNYNDYNGMQTWLVPKTGTYRITATGANGQSHTTPGFGGKGGIISATFNLTEGEAILIVVGQCRSGTVTGTTGGAGGGASWVYRLFNSTIYYPTSPTPLIGAGGGGGAYNSSNGQNVSIANTVGTAASATSSLAGGSSFVLNNSRTYGLFGHMESANSFGPGGYYKYPFTSLDPTVGVFGGGGRSVSGSSVTGGGAGWRSAVQGSAVGAGAGTCWSSNTTYVFSSSILNGRTDGNGEVNIELLP